MSHNYHNPDIPEIAEMSTDTGSASVKIPVMRATYRASGFDMHDSLGLSASRRDHDESEGVGMKIADSVLSPRSVLPIPPVACVGMLVAGSVTAFADSGYYPDGGFFAYRFTLLDLPYWVFSELVIVGVNGIALLRFAFLEGALRTRAGEWSAHVPLQHLRLLAINLVVISLLVLGFYVVRAANV